MLPWDNIATDPSNGIVGTWEIRVGGGGVQKVRQSERAKSHLVTILLDPREILYNLMLCKQPVSFFNSLSSQQPLLKELSNENKWYSCNSYSQAENIKVS